MCVCVHMYVDTYKVTGVYNNGHINTHKRCCWKLNGYK